MVTFTNKVRQVNYGVGQKSIWVFHNILWEKPNEHFGQVSNLTEATQLGKSGGRSRTQA